MGVSSRYRADHAFWVCMIVIGFVVACFAAALPSYQELDPQARAYYARVPGGRLLTDEEGHPLKFDSPSAAEAYADDFVHDRQ